MGEILNVISESAERYLANLRQCIFAPRTFDPPINQLLALVAVNASLGQSALSLAFRDSSMQIELVLLLVSLVMWAMYAAAFAFLPSLMQTGRSFRALFSNYLASYSVCYAAAAFVFLIMTSFASSTGHVVPDVVAMFFPELSKRTNVFFTISLLILSIAVANVSIRATHRRHLAAFASSILVLLIVVTTNILMFQGSPSMPMPMAPPARVTSHSSYVDGVIKVSWNVGNTRHDSRIEMYGIFGTSSVTFLDNKTHKTITVRQNLKFEFSDQELALLGTNPRLESGAPLTGHLDYSPDTFLLHKSQNGDLIVTQVCDAQDCYPAHSIGGLHWLPPASR